LQCAGIVIRIGEEKRQGHEELEGNFGGLCGGYVFCNLKPTC